MKIILMMMVYFFFFFQWELVRDCVKAKAANVVSVSYNTTSMSCDVSYTVAGSVFRISGFMFWCHLSFLLQLIFLPYIQHKVSYREVLGNHEPLIWYFDDGGGHICLAHLSKIPYMCPFGFRSGDCEDCSMWFTYFSYSSKHSAVMPCVWGHCPPVKKKKKTLWTLKNTVSQLTLFSSVSGDAHSLSLFFCVCDLDPIPDFDLSVNQLSKSITVTVEPGEKVYARWCYQKNAVDCRAPSPRITVSITGTYICIFVHIVHR